MSLGKRLKKVAKKVGVTASRTLMVAAPVLGAAVAGPLGAAAGTAIGAAAAKAGGGGSTRVKRALMIGGAVTGATGIGAIFGGSGLTGSILGPIQKLFGGGSAQPTAEEQAAADAVDDQMRGSGEVDVQNPGAKSSYGGILSDVLGAATKLLGGGDKAAGTEREPASDTSGGGGPDDVSQGGDGSSGGISGAISRVPKWALIGIPVVLIGGYFLFRSRRKAA